jgi:hypothetical protein
MRAGLREPQRVNGRQGVSHLPDIVDAVAIDTIGGGRVARSNPFAVNARQVLSVLIDSLFRAVLVHQCRVAVAARAELRYGGTRDLSDESARAAHRCLRVVGSAVTSVAVGARKAPLPVNAVAEKGRRFL